MKEDESVVEFEIGDDLTVEVTLLVIVVEAVGVTVHVKDDIMIEVTETEEETEVTVVADPGVIAEAAVEGTEGLEILAETQRGIEMEEGEVAEAEAQVAEVTGDPPLAIVAVGV